MKPSLKFNQQLILIQLLFMIHPIILPLLFSALIGVRYSGITLSTLTILGLLFCLQQLYVFFTQQKSLCLSRSKNYIIFLEIAYLVLTLINFFQQPLWIAILPVIQWLIVHSYIFGNVLAPKSHLLFYTLQLLLFQTQFLYATNSLVPGFRGLWISFLALLGGVLTVYPFFMPDTQKVNKPATFGMGIIAFVLSTVFAFWLSDMRWYTILLAELLLMITSVPISFIYYRSNHSLTTDETITQPTAKTPKKRRDASDSYNNRHR